MSVSEFQVIYDGPALQSSTMNARELSASLAALDELFESADNILNNGKTKQTLKVMGSFETGSFKINLSSSQSAIDRAKDLLNSQEAAAIIAAGDLVQIVLFGSGSILGLIGLVKFLKGGIPTKYTRMKTERLGFIVVKATSRLSVRRLGYIMTIKHARHLKRRFRHLLRRIDLLRLLSI